MSVVNLAKTAAKLPEAWNSLPLGQVGAAWPPIVPPRPSTLTGDDLTGAVQSAPVILKDGVDHGVTPGTADP